MTQQTMVLDMHTLQNSIFGDVRYFISEIKQPEVNTRNVRAKKRVPSPRLWEQKIRILFSQLLFGEFVFPIYSVQQTLWLKYEI